MDSKEELHCLLSAIILAGIMAGDNFGVPDKDDIKTAVESAASIYNEVEKFHLTKKKEN